MTFDVANMRRRILSSLVLIPVVLASVYYGGWIYAGLVTVFLGLALYEWLRLIDPELDRGAIIFAIAAQILIMFGAAWQNVILGFELGIVFTGVLFFLARLCRARSALWIAFGLPYMAGSGLALLYLRATPGTGLALAFYLLAVVWGTDSGAFIVGRLIGGPKLAPQISPSKTWAGLLGGMVLAAIFGYGVARVMGSHEPQIAISLAIILACVAQLGDLFKSMFKRRAGVKESGFLIPGHGGVLDRIDGLISAAILLALFQHLAGSQIQWW